MSDSRLIARVSDLPQNESQIYRIEDTEGRVREAFLLTHDGNIVSWLNYCRHVTHVRLDTGTGVTTRNGEIVCTNHGAMFETSTGVCTLGPCEGAVLEPVGIQLEDGDVLLDDPEYTFVGPGPMPRDDANISSTSHLEF